MPQPSRSNSRHPDRFNPVPYRPALPSIGMNMMQPPPANAAPMTGPFTIAGPPKQTLPYRPVPGTPKDARQTLPYRPMPGVSKGNSIIPLSIPDVNRAIHGPIPSRASLRKSDVNRAGTTLTGPIKQPEMADQPQVVRTGRAPIPGKWSGAGQFARAAEAANFGTATPPALPLGRAVEQLDKFRNPQDYGGLHTQPKPDVYSELTGIKSDRQVRDARLAGMAPTSSMKTAAAHAAQTRARAARAAAEGRALGDMGTVVGPEFARRNNIAGNPGDTVMFNGQEVTIGRDMNDPLYALGRPGDQGISNVVMGVRGRFGGDRPEAMGPVPGSGDLTKNEKFKEYSQRLKDRRAQALETRRQMLPYRTAGMPMNSVFVGEDGNVDHLRTAGRFRDAAWYDYGREQMAEKGRQFDVAAKMQRQEARRKHGLDTRRMNFDEDMGYGNLDIQRDQMEAARDFETRRMAMEEDRLSMEQDELEMKLSQAKSQREVAEIQTRMAEVEAERAELQLEREKDQHESKYGKVVGAQIAAGEQNIDLSDPMVVTDQIDMAIAQLSQDGHEPTRAEVEDLLADQGITPRMIDDYFSGRGDFDAPGFVDAGTAWYNPFAWQPFGWTKEEMDRYNKHAKILRPDYSWD